MIIGYVWPEPRSSAAGGRMMQLVKLFKSEGFEVTFASSARETDHMADLENLGVRTEQIEVNSSEFDRFLRDLQPSIVLFDRFITEEQFGWRVAKHCPEAIRLLDTEDLHFLRRARRKAVADDHAFNNNMLLQEETARREVASIYRSDLSLIISEAEMELLTEVFDVDQQLLLYLPFMLGKIGDQQVRQWPAYEERQHFMTIGNFRHPPNWDAVLQLKHKVWPAIRERLPSAELHVYGAYTPQKAMRLHKPGEGFFIEGRADSAGEVMRRARICLAPLRFGAGLKGKLIEAMQHGTPSVTTPIGAEGLAGDMDWAGAIADTPGEIAEKATSLYGDRGAWEQAQENGRQIINRRFAQADFKARLLDSIARIREGLQAHRRNNFVGQMLMHHTTASTEFMSRWIEEKNS